MTNLGTISYDTAGTNFNIIETITEVTSEVQHFTVNTIGISELKIDIHPIGLIGDYSYEIFYTISDLNTSVRLIGDGGEQDGERESSLDMYTNSWGYSPYSSDENYLFLLDDWGADNYIIYDDTSFNYSFDPHLIVDTTNNSVVFHVKNASELSYVIDITPISGTAASSTADTTTLTAVELLSNYNVTISDASDFIMANINNLSHIYDISKQYSITNDMIAEILQDEFPEVSGTDVANYFAYNGIDSTSLGGSVPTVDYFIA